MVGVSLPFIPATLLCLVLAIPLTQQQQIVLPGGFTEQPQEFMCENITTVEFCREIYPTASFPNFRGHASQRDANKELLNFVPLIQGVCSEAIVHFLCSIYAPFCQPGRDNIRVSPCRELCQFVRSTCEEPLNEFNLDWPPHLECSNFAPDADTNLDFCPDNIETLRIPSNVPTDPPGTASPGGSDSPNTTSFSGPIGDTTSPPDSTRSPSVALSCPTHLVVSSGLENRSYSFGGVNNCGVNCTGLYFTQVERNIVAPVFILLFAVICVLFTLFSVATFLIDRRRFHYPERPIIFISFCYLVVSVIYMVGAISKLSGSNNEAFSCSDNIGKPGAQSSTSFVLQRLPNSESTYKSASCVILFVAVYFFQMASAIWWIVLTLTWFLAAALKWGEEAVEKLWLLYHIISWGVPAIQVILVLALRLVDGDQLSGLCSTGNSNNVGLGVFYFFPLLLYLVTGAIFLVIGFTALVNIRRQLQRDVAKAKKIGRLILRVGIYSLLYITPNVVFLILVLYELSRKKDWEVSYLQDCGSTSPGSECTASITPSFAAFVLKYMMLFIVGICSTSWIFSSKTFAAWQKLFCSCCGTPPPGQYDIPHNKYDMPNPQQYVLPEKHGDLALRLPHPHTAV